MFNQVKFSDGFIQELKDRNDISDVISGYVGLKRKGRNMVGLCPFHSEKTASFFIYPGNESFYCFGCGAGGDVITFIRLIENLDYIEAIKYLAQRVGMPLPELEKDDGSHQTKLLIYEINRELARFYHFCLNERQGKAAFEYLIKRGLKIRTIRHFGLGYSPADGFSAVNHLRRKGYNDEMLVTANVASISQKGRLYDRFRGRVMFPIMDLRGNVIAFGGRSMENSAPKYLNTSDTLVFKKSENIFALNFAKNKMKKNFILAEGYMDVIALHQAGFENAIATLGTALTDGQVRLMSRFTKEVIVSYDSDEAGRKASDRAIKLCRANGLLVKVLNIPKGKDPDEFMKSYGKEGRARFKNLVETSMSDMEYKFERIKSRYDLDKSEDKVKYLNECIKVLSELNNAIECEIYAGKLSDETGIERKSILLQVERVKKKRAKVIEGNKFKQIQKNISGMLDKPDRENGVSLREIKAEEMFLSTLINNLDMLNNISYKVKPSLFMNDLNRRIYEAICKLNLEGRPIDVTTISAEGFTMKEAGYITKLICEYLPSSEVKKDMNDYIFVIKSEKEANTINSSPNIDKNEAKNYIEKLRNIKK